MSPWFRRRRTEFVPSERLPESSEDPVGDVIADAPPIEPRLPGPPPDLEKLRALIAVTDMGNEGEPGFNTQVILQDEVRDFADVADGIELVLLEQPGITAAEGIEREIWIVQSNLSPADVAAAFVRSIVEINRSPCRQT